MVPNLSTRKEPHSCSWRIVGQELLDWLVFKEVMLRTTVPLTPMLCGGLQQGVWGPRAMYVSRAVSVGPGRAAVPLCFWGSLPSRAWTFAQLPSAGEEDMGEGGPRGRDN